MHGLNGLLVRLIISQEGVRELHPFLGQVFSTLWTAALSLALQRSGSGHGPSLLVLKARTLVY